MNSKTLRQKLSYCSNCVYLAKKGKYFNMSSHPTMNNFGRSFVRIFLTLLLLSVGYMNFWKYSQEFKKQPDMYFDVMQGTANAPQQYRVLVVHTALFLHNHGHLKTHAAFAFIDLIAAFVACFTLLCVLERSGSFRRSGITKRMLAYATFLFLCAYYFIWLDWYQRPETLPSACFVALMLFTLTLRPSTKVRYGWIIGGALLLTLAQALTRADVAVCVYAGIGLTALLSEGRNLPQPRSFLLPLSVVACLLAVSVQWIMMHHVYPHANYGDTQVFQLLFNLAPPSLFAAFAFTLPVLWTGCVAIRKWTAADTALLALLPGAALFLVLWSTIGRIQEVRIFLPFALCLIPLTVCYVLELTPAP